MADFALSIRERTWRAVRSELSTVALGLFLERGFEQTTVDQIATAAGVSRRSFFRYFSSKQDVLAQAFAGAGQSIAAALAADAAAEAPWTALRQAFEPLVISMTTDERALPLARLVLNSPNLLSGELYEHGSWQELIATALRSRSPADLDQPGQLELRLGVTAISGAAIACLMSATMEWVTGNGEAPLTWLLDIAMGAVAPIAVAEHTCPSSTATTDPAGL